MGNETAGEEIEEHRRALAFRPPRERQQRGRRAGEMDTWQAKWKPPRPVHRNPCLVFGCTDEAALKEAFGKFGALAEVFEPKGQSFAFIRFEDNHDAEPAMSALNGTSIGGSEVQVTDGKCANAVVSKWRATCLQTWQQQSAKA